MILSFMIPIYGRLVLAGEMEVDDTNTGKKQVPNAYKNAVIDWLIQEEENRLSNKE